MAAVIGSLYVSVTVKVYGVKRAKVGIWIIGKIAGLFGIKVEPIVDVTEAR